MTKCEYCCNNSGKTDKYGNCISCGAPMSDGIPRFIIRDEAIYWNDRGLTTSTLSTGQAMPALVLDDDLNCFRWEQNGAK